LIPCHRSAVVTFAGTGGANSGMMMAGNASFVVESTATVRFACWLASCSPLGYLDVVSPVLVWLRCT
jgi:hypothetical protein